MRVAHVRRIRPCRKVQRTQVVVLWPFCRSSSSLVKICALIFAESDKVDYSLFFALVNLLLLLVVISKKYSDFFSDDFDESIIGQS